MELWPPLGEISLTVLLAVMTPVVILLAAIMLLAWQLFRYGNDIKKLANSNLIADMRELNGHVQFVKTEFRGVADHVKNLHQEVEKIKEAMDQRDTEGLKEELSKEEHDSDIVHSQPSSGAEDPDQLDADELFLKIEKDWAKFTDEFKAVMSRKGKGDLYNGKSLRTTARHLTHGNYRNALTEEDVELIGKLQARYKRFAPLKSTKEEWLDTRTYQQFAAMHKRVKETIESVG